MVDKDSFKVTEKTAKYRTEIQQMMFVSGETGEPSGETTTMIEGIVQQQVMEILTRATETANRRGSRSIAIEDLIFQIRHNKAKVARLQSFLAWKDVRKTARTESEDKAGGGDDMVGGTADDPFGPGANPADAAAKVMSKNKRSIKLPWDVSSFYNVQLPERDDDEADQEYEEMNSASLLRLKNQDERTRSMTKEEYVHYSECRQASFTFRKGKRFREWAGFGTVTDSKPNDDIVDILGFLTYEIVQTLTEEGLKVKAAEDASAKLNGGRGGAAGEEVGRKRKREIGPFDPPEEERQPVQPSHIREAFRILQQPDKRFKTMSFARKGPVRVQLKLI